MITWKTQDGPGDPEAIGEMERRLGYAFPKTYKKIAGEYEGAYLRDDDAFRFFSQLTKKEAVYGFGRMLGFTNRTSDAENLPWLWQHKPEDFPEGLVPFSQEGGGNFICFDYRSNSQSANPPIVVWHYEGAPGSEQEISFVADSFDEFLEMLTPDCN